jgi:ribonuclease BN (tRNA processing enzyme)
MKVELFGTRGSVPVSSKTQVEHGGNTTSIMIRSKCLPNNTYLIVDAGSGIVPLSNEIMKEQGGNIFAPNGNVEVNILFTHWHHDHTQGLFLSPLTFIKTVRMNLLGPVDHSIGPREMMNDMMKPRIFQSPLRKSLAFQLWKSGISCFKRDCLSSIGGKKIMAVEQYERFLNNGGHVPVGKSGKYPIKECLVVKMFKSNHPEQTISYRFEEHPTGKIFVFLTDHENQSGIPSALRAHISNIDLLILDGQYTQEKYDKTTAGWGHGTGSYCATLAFQCNVKKLGVTHHDPSSSDEQIEKILSESRNKLTELIGSAKAPGIKPDDIFTCHDYQVVEV